ncbi:MAG TPA: isoprenylcysteine carboxylmethyltransferase family protein [Fimbriimonadaceae bacterium]|jgi:protein-S-isoprenylcysteine O-methyltransferase Ste14
MKISSWANAALGFLWLVFWIYWLVSAAFAKKTVRPTGQTWFISRIVLIALVVIVCNLPVARTFFRERLLPSDELFDWSAVLICALGFAFAIWARVHLGRNWGMPMTMREEPELVTSGPYRFVRHPIYSGILLALLGTSLVGLRVWLLVFFFFVAYFVFSAVTEEKLMAETFPEQYQEYKKRSKMIVPFLF